MAILTEIQELSSSSSSSSSSSRKYHVFLSFRGKDTRLGFTDYLYQALVNENISTFRDEEEAEIGEELKPELERAIKDSRASIIVLSQNFASSTWCLDELVMILEQRKASNHIVVPVFYNIEPTHVRKQEGAIGDALFKHKQRMDAEKDEDKRKQGPRKLEIWRKGLTEVSGIIGIDTNGRREMVVIEELVKEISSRLELHLESNIPHLIGMDSSIDTVSSWLKGGSSETAEILTISGVGGIGKTSLAKYIFGLNYSKFERSSFIEDIERRCAGARHTRSLLELQKQLLGDIVSKRLIEEHNVDVLTSKIEKALVNKQTLLVLDGVDNFEQVDVLIGTNGSLHPGSKIIVTTKDGSIIEKCALFRMKFPPRHIKHALHGLSDTGSLQLLCWHAFGGNDPKEGYKEKAIRASEYCKGHPLALKLLGSSLYNEDVEAWSDTFDMLGTGEFQTRVQKVLQISFDSLPSENCKELFKHIACFFVEKDREVTEAILKGCGIRTSYGLKKLIDRCLITTLGNILKMHQLLQEMGRDLVRRESPEKPWKRSRVCSHEESLYLLKEEKGTTKIQGLVLDMKMLEKESLHRSSSDANSEFQNNDLNTIFGLGLPIHSVPKFSYDHTKKIELRTTTLSKMDNLDLLQISYVKFKGSYENFPKGLKGLCMNGFKLKYIPSDLPMENLVALEMSYSNLTQLWKKPKLLRSLKFLNLSYCKLVKVGGFSGLLALERLILKGCESLVHLCDSIGGCDNLVLLDLSNCIKLKKIPSTIIKLKNLKKLYLDGCKASICTQSSHTTSSPISQFVPRSPKSLLISLPSSLVELSLNENNLFNESFPADFSSMSMLKTLSLDRNPIVSIPDCVRTLSRLEFLSAGGCWDLKSVLCPTSTVKCLTLNNCDSLVKITLPPEISEPPYVFYHDSRLLTEVEGRFKFQDIDDEILCSLGWKLLQHVKDHNVVIRDSDSSRELTTFPLQMYCEYGIFSTCFSGNAVPDWLDHKINGPSISFTMPLSSMNKKIQGINICFVHTGSTRGVKSQLMSIVRNVTKDRTWAYISNIIAFTETGEDIVWLNHWMFGNNELEHGDEVSVGILSFGPTIVKECAVSPVYNDKENDDDPLSYYKSWKHIIGGDLSCFQRESGEYILMMEFLIPSLFLPTCN
ncbi:hypothetical protein LXL04_039567 [Taraxacum kok-saghyz]